MKKAQRIMTFSSGFQIPEKDKTNLLEDPLVKIHVQEGILPCPNTERLTPSGQRVKVK